MDGDLGKGVEGVIGCWVGDGVVFCFVLNMFASVMAPGEGVVG